MSETAVPLAQRPCVPCRGGVEALTRQQCVPYLAELRDWFRGLAFDHDIKAQGRKLEHAIARMHSKVRRDGVGIIHERLVRKQRRFGSAG